MSIKKENSGERLDKFLKENEEVFFNGEVSRSEIARFIKFGKVLVNQKTAKPSYILKEGDQIEANVEIKENKLEPNNGVNLDVIHEDENIVVVNKPAGMQVHPGFKRETDTLVNVLIARYPEIISVHDESEDAWMRPGIVHRLDRDTSGVMIIARNQEAFFELKKKFKEREVEKTYVAIVYGRLEDKEGVINKPIARATTYKKQVIAGKKTKTTIREAVTEYSVLEEFNGFSLVEVKPKTGRMHQIRVHLTSIGHPIVGDSVYTLKNLEVQTTVKRHLLHAKSIKFNLNGHDYFFEAPLPEDFRELLLDLNSR